MANNEKYNGYNNYETWLVALWIDNDEYRQCEARRIARREPSLAHLSDALKEWVESWDEVYTACDAASIVADLINAALSEVDWYELAEMYAKEAQEEDDE